MLVNNTQYTGMKFSTFFPSVSHCSVESLQFSKLFAPECSTFNYVDVCAILRFITFVGVSP